MCVFESAAPAENILRQRCANRFLPFCGGLELIRDGSNICNAAVIHRNRRDTHENSDGKEFLSGGEWIRIIDEAYAMGIYYLLFTGEDPLLHPDFRNIYAHAAEKGIAVSLKTDGLLIDSNLITFFRKYGCRKFTIVLHGTDNESYQSYSGLADGFDRVIHVLKILKDNGFDVQISCPIDSKNRNQIDEINHIGRNLEIPVQFTAYTYPEAVIEPGNKEKTETNCRMSAEQAADSAIDCFRIQNPHLDNKTSSRYLLNKITRLTGQNSTGFSCYAARSDFWISWNGQLRPCGEFVHPAFSYNLLQSSFQDAWERMVRDTQSETCQCEECGVCSIRGLCQSCAAACYRENERFDKKPEYLCAMTGEMVNICREAIEADSDTQPLISMIVPAYNDEKYLSRCVNSILQQSFTQFELILVDDGSTDQSSAICDAFQMIDPRIKVIHQTNKGVSSARNAGIRAAVAPWITFCDSDDYVERDYFRILYHTVQDRKDSLIITNSWAGNELKNRAICFKMDFDDLNHVRIEDSINHMLFVYVWNKIYSREVLMEHGILFDESLNFKEDDLFNREYCRYCTEAVFIPEPLYVHVNHNGLTKKGLIERGIELKDVDSNAIMLPRMH